MSNPFGTDTVCTTTTGSRIRRCVEVDGDGDGNVQENDLTPQQERALASAFHGFILDNDERDLTPYGKEVRGTGTPNEFTMIRAVSQFVGAVMTEGQAWARVQYISISSDVGFVANAGGQFDIGWQPVAQVALSSGRIEITGYRGGFFNPNVFNSPSNLARILIHESLHFVFGSVPWDLHLRLDRNARTILRTHNLDGGGCVSLEGLPSC